VSFELIDIGINLAHDSYDADREAVLQRALRVGVVQSVVTGASVEGTRAAIELARATPRILRATAGCHPHHAVDLDEAAFAALADLATDPLVSAVGETGLDYHREFFRPARAAPRLRAPAAARHSARQTAVPARARCACRLPGHAARASRVPARARCCTASPAAAPQLEACLEFGLYIGITGWICDERRGLHLRDIVQSGARPAG
jgi:TatD DNase family protein